MSDKTIENESTVTLHFSLKLEDGSVVDSTFEREPARFTLGDGSMLAGFEQALIGLKAGDKHTAQITPEQGFGQPNPNNVQTFSRSDFSVDQQLEVGLVISFADASKAELPGVVSSIDGDTVKIDFNHPLAGRTIEFNVEIINVA